MTSANAPSPYFNGITYNPSFFSSSSSGSGSGITIGAANALYLRKAYADTATSVETFTGGIRAYNYDAVSAAASITIGAGQTGVGGGALNLGSSGSRTGPINIGNNVVPIDIDGPITTSGSTFSMIYGATGTITAGNLSLNSIYGNVSIEAPLSSAINLGATSTTGIINIGTGGRNQNINIGTGATGGTLSLGSSSMPVSILGAFTLASVGTTGAITTSAGDIQATTGKVKTGTLDAVVDTIAGTTALKIGSNIYTGDIEIGNSQTSGDIKIGLSDTTGAMITIGTSATATTINGTLTTGAIGGGAITGTSFIGPTYNGTAGNATDMSFGASQTTGSIAIGGSQAGASTTGRINIGINST